MRKFILIVMVFVSIKSIGYSQTNNNPDPDGVPSIVGDVREMCGDIWSDVEDMIITPISNGTNAAIFQVQ